ncbi:related to DFG5 protein [Cephalotrichum gorgonifer]|uniref:Mannan endo-1,6-alpha-mannosidase n=1 Tax=Cephalotrichum gorgonifer TaxID=2041049 RepID=A0AAE8MZ98_9PEZI|nr:related to DFG5 protein [Cephalotrichum gorgonifer]
MAIPTVTRLGASALLLALSGVNAENPFSIDTDADIRTSAALLAHDTMVYYKGNLTGETPGLLPGPPPTGDYYWWQSGALWGTLIDYWQLTGDSSYNNVIIQGMMHQVGQNNDFQPRNISASQGNDDQAFWGMAALQAAELDFPSPPSDQPQWLALAQAVFDAQTARRDEECGGGLRWQIAMTNVGYDYKNTISNACFFNMGARLARYTGNETYSKLAGETWDWIQSVGFISDKGDVYDGAFVDGDCTDINKAQFSYSAAILVQGAAFMWNITEDQAWKDRLEGLLDRTLEVFFRDDGVAYEASCEPQNTCTTDMYSFKGFLHRWLAQASQVAPFIADKVTPILRSSTEAAIKQCTGGDSGRECGFSWSSGKFDGNTGAGQEMNVLAAVSSLLAPGKGGPSTEDSSAGTGNGDGTGNGSDGTSDGDDAGNGSGLLRGPGFWISSFVAFSYFFVRF